MTNELEYVVKDALMICDKGAAPGFFMPTHNMHIKVSGCLVTNRMDMLPVVNNTDIRSLCVYGLSLHACSYHVAKDI